MQRTSFLSDYCETLENPSFGQVTYNRNATDQGYSTDTRATYSCNNLYEQTGGSDSRQCNIYGQWSGSAAICTLSKYK